MSSYSCGKCDLCCTILPIDDEDLKKTSFTRCQHSSACGGCSIYGKHPAPCKAFECGWKLFKLQDYWKPNKCGMVINLGRFPTETLGIWVTDDRWQKDPWLKDIVTIARFYFEKYRQLTFIYPAGYVRFEAEFWAVDLVSGKPLKAAIGDAVAFVGGHTLRVARQDHEAFNKTVDNVEVDDIFVHFMNNGWRIVEDNRLVRWIEKA